jgi:hypothetical protein
MAMAHDVRMIESSDARRCVTADQGLLPSDQAGGAMAGGESQAPNMSKQRAESRGEVVLTKLSPWSMADTVARLAAVLAARGMKVFAVIDHADEARSVGLALRDTKVFIVGSPSLSAAAIEAQPLAALDLYPANRRLGGRVSNEGQLPISRRGSSPLRSGQRPCSGAREHPCGGQRSGRPLEKRTKSDMTVVRQVDATIAQVRRRFRRTTSPRPISSTPARRRSPLTSTC